ncbi:uncharacterized protein [Anabrus simplex]|uniref:uncharacterized protein isoform X2 n=1 Tax=Anabrus simplex TaxID=316456 RepID=UPI0035A26E91
MTSILQLDNLDCSSNTSEQITKLFPKCRPRDINLNPVTLQDDNIVVMMDADTERCVAAREGCGEGEPEEEGPCCEENEDDSSEGELHEEEDVIIDHTQQQQQHSDSSNSEVIVVTSGKGGTYKLRDSRIIEIAGGRELFSQSRSKATRKSRYIEDMDKHNSKRNKTQGVWELRSICGEPKKQRNSREVTETVFSTEVRSVRHQRVTNSPSGPVCYDNGTTPPLNVAVVTSGEVVVFDDIGDDWRGLRLDLQGMDLDGNGTDNKEALSSAGSSPSPPTYHRTASDFFKTVTSVNDLDRDSLSPEHNNKVTRVIGNLPIAEYEGSPRRYGPRQLDVSQSHPVLPSAQSLLASPSVYPPRPGFPQRVLPNSSDQSLPPSSSNQSPGGSTFDYLYEFSETRKVLEEFFKCPGSTSDGEKGASCSDFQELEYELRRQAGAGSAYVGQRLAKGAAQQDASDVSGEPEESPRKLAANSSDMDNLQEQESHLLDLSADTGSTEDLGDTEVGLQVGHSRNFTLSPETTDCDSNCGDLDSEVSLLLMESEGPGGGGGSGDITGGPQDSMRLHSSMPVLEDGLSSGHASDTDNNNPTVLLMKRQITEIEREIIQRSSRGNGTSSKLSSSSPENRPVQPVTSLSKESANLLKSPAAVVEEMFTAAKSRDNSYDTTDPELEALDPLAGGTQMTPPPPAPQPHRSLSLDPPPSDSVEAAIKDIRLALQRTKTLPLKSPPTEEALDVTDSPIWVPRRRTATSNELEQRKPHSGEEGGEEEEADTDLETDRLLGQQRTDDHGFFDDKVGWRKPKSRTVMPSTSNNKTSTPIASNKQPASLTTPSPSDSNCSPLATTSNTELPANPLVTNSTSNDDAADKTPSPQKDSASTGKSKKDKESSKKKGRNKEVLIEGVLFRANYLGSTQLVCEGQPTKTTRMNQAEEAVSRIKAPEGETQPSTEVDLFISTEKIMVLNTDLKEIMMDHALRTISYIADIGDLVVLMARRRFVPHDVEEAPKINRTPKMICHVFESEEAQFIAQSIGQAFQVAYMEFLKANGIEDHSFVKEMDYQEVLNSQEIFGDELQMFAKKEMQKEVVVPKAKGEILGVVIVESGWGSMLPTVVIANLAPAGAAARCGQLNIGDQIIAINGVSLVGLPLSTCQNYIKNTKNQTVVKLTVVPCAPVVEVKIKRPDTKYQLGFSVQNGVICSLLRGGIAERGGVRVGHRIIEINNQSVVAVPHEKIVNLLATSVGEILMKTMPTSMFRLLTGQETPVYI